LQQTHQSVAAIEDLSIFDAVATAQIIKPLFLYSKKIFLIFPSLAVFLVIYRYTAGYVAFKSAT
jgi:hypothetical protein